MKYGQNGLLISTKYLEKQVILNFVFISKKNTSASFLCKCKKYKM